MTSAATLVSRGKRVLFVINDPRFFVTHRLALAEGVRKAGYAVHVAAPTQGYDTATQTIRAAGFPLHSIPIERQGLNPIRDLRALVRLVELYSSLRPDIVHHVTVKPVVYGTIAARFTRVPAVINAISGLGRLFGTTTPIERLRAAFIRGVYRVTLRHRAMKAIFQNEEDRATFLRARIVDDSAAVLITGSGTNLQKFDPGAQPEHPPVIILPARILRQKGVREFIEAARILRAKGSAARFAIVGDDAGNRDAVPRRELEDAERNGIVELWGWSDDFPTVMQRATIVCLPTYHEGLPKALIDACAAGRPIVATDIPGCRAVVENDRNGLLVPVKNSHALAEALSRLLADQALRQRMGQAGRQKAEALFDIQLVVTATLKAYASLPTLRDL